MWSLKTLAMLKCESRTSLHAVQYKWQPGSVLMFCSYYFKNGQPKHFALMFCATASLALFLFSFSFFFCCCQNQGFCSYKMFFFIKKGMYDCNVQIIVWCGSGIRFPCKYETPEKIAYVMCYTVLNWNDIWNRILIFETHDIRKITSISCISENENNI